MAYLLIVILLLCSAFFSGTEIAYTSLSKIKIKKEISKNESNKENLSTFKNRSYARGRPKENENFNNRNLNKKETP